MANTSDASGTLSFEGAWSTETKLDFLYILSTLEYVGYNTVLADGFETEYQRIRNDFTYSTLSFFGNGRWTFNRNLTNFNDWADCTEEEWIEINSHLSSTYRITYDEFKYKRTHLINQMYNLNLKIHWCYQDFENGNQVLCTVEGIHSIKYNNENVLEFSYTELNCQDYECNLKNYVHIIDGDLSDRINDIASDIITSLYKQDYSFADTVYDLIISDDDYFNLEIYYNCITIEDIPDRLYLLLQDAYQEHLLNIKINSI